MKLPPVQLIFSISSFAQSQESPHSRAGIPYSNYSVERDLLFPHGLGPFVIGVAVAVRGHEALDASLSQFLFELLTDKWILVWIFDLILSAVFDLLRMAMELHRRMERQISRHVAASIEMLVKPLVGRGDHTALVQRANDLLFAIFPHNRIPFARRNDDGAARAVPVRFLVSLRREDRHMRGQF